MPLFSRTNQADAESFITLVQSDAVRENDMTAIIAGGRRIILTRYDGQLYAFDQTCPHAAADLSKGTIHRRRICCHEHDYCFDIQSGRIIWPEDEVYRLRTYEVMEEEGIVKIRLEKK
jgi:nitrite reductase/ring-hydroxylating ferredoxin subunit